MKKKSLGILLSLMGAACLYTGCNNDVTPGQEGAECSPACGENQECVNGECKDLETPPLPPECNPACGENQECVNGECKDKQTEPETKPCANANETNCDGGCFDLTSDKDNCGECGKICPAGEICENSQCKAEEVEAECQDSETPSCDGNSIKKCVNGKYELTSCGNDTCEDGECKAKDIAECSDDMQPLCEGNSVKSCKSGHYDLQDCQNKACVAGACSDENFEKECDNDGVSVCDNNQVKTCKAGKFEYQNCTLAGLTCETTDEGVACVAVEKPECTENDAPTCEGNSLKSCVDGKFAFEACPGICENGACKAVAIEDLCPDDASKTAPGVCGCGIPDIDSNNDGTMDCQELGSNGKPLDLCPDDPNKLLPGICGCGIPDDINENSGNPYCLEHGDLCPEDANKTMPGVCGCGYSDKINGFTNIPECIGVDIVGSKLDLCPDDSNKLLAGTCGCGIADTLDSEKHIPACVLSEEDLCVNDAEKTKPGICGCGVVDNETDTDNDGVPDCIDQCPNNPVKYIDDDCGCDEIKISLDGTNFCAIPINTAADFNDLKNGTLSPSKNYALMNDINLYDYFGSTIMNDWVGVQNFTGRLVSTGKTISFKNSSTNERGKLKCANDTCGLFKDISNGTIWNVGFEYDVESAFTKNIGGLSGNISKSVINKVTYTGNVTKTATSGENVGGIAGYSTGTTYSNIKHNGDVNAYTYDTGGIVGQASTCIFSSIESSGNISGFKRVGGIVGHVENATSSFIDIEVNGKIEGQTFVGGIVGHYNYSNSITATNLTNKADIIADRKEASWGSLVGGIFGKLGSGTGETSLFNQTKGEITNLFNYGNITVKHPLKDVAQGKYVNESDCVGGITGGGGGPQLIYRNVHNYGNITTSSGHSIGGIIGFTVSSSLYNVSNSGNITSEGNSKRAGTGGTFMGGIVGAYGIWDGSSNQTYEYVFENVKNKGTIKGGGDSVGGIGGGFGTMFEYISFTGRNIVNEGDIIANSDVDNTTLSSNEKSGIGGLFGYFYCHHNCSLSGIYSTGNVKGTFAPAGGLIGRLSVKNSDWNNNLIASSKARAINVKIDKAYSTGAVNSANTAGGLIGLLPLDFTNTNGSTYYDVDYNVLISNAYAIGEVKGNTSGGLVGMVKGYSRSATFNSQNVKQANKLTFANSFAVNSIEGTTAGGLIGNYNYANGLGDNYKHVINNLYATSMMPNNTGALFGTNPSNVLVKNTYYWSKAAENVTPDSTVSGVLAFDYDDAKPIITQDNVNLLNQLNANLKASSTEELNAKVSANWIEKEHVITGKVKAKIPFLEIAPEEMPWEADPQQEETGRD